MMNVLVWWFSGSVFEVFSVLKFLDYGDDLDVCWVRDLFPKAALEPAECRPDPEPFPGGPRPPSHCLLVCFLVSENPC